MYGLSEHCVTSLVVTWNLSVGCSSEMQKPSSTYQLLCYLSLIVVTLKENRIKDTVVRAKKNNSNNNRNKNNKNAKQKNI